MEAEWSLLLEWRNRDTDRLLCPGTPQGPAQYQNNSVNINRRESMGFKRSSRYHNLGYVNTCALFRTTWAAYLKVCVSICICVHVHRYLYSSELYLSLEIYDCMINTWASSFISCPREVCQGQHETIWESRSSSTFCWLSFNFWSPLRLFLIFFFFSFIPSLHDIWKHLVQCLGFPGGSVLKNSPASAGDTGLIPWPGRSPGERNGNPL